MKILLIKDVKSLGKAGEIKDVKDGYGQNFLIAKGYAKAATTEVLRKYKAEIAKKQEELRYEIEQANLMKDDLEKITICIKKPIGDNGSLFGSVTKDEISSSLKNQFKFDIDKKNFEIDEMIKSVGIYEVKVKLAHTIKATLKIEVKGE